MPITLFSLSISLIPNKPYNQPAEMLFSFCVWGFFSPVRFKVADIYKLTTIKENKRAKPTNKTAQAVKSLVTCDAFLIDETKQQQKSMINDQHAIVKQENGTK